MAVTIEGIAAALGLIVTGSVVTGLAVRLILMPYFEKALIDPIREDIRKIRKQVENSHKTNLRDDLTEVIERQDHILRLLESR